MSEYVRQIKILEKKVISKLGSIDIELTERCNNNCIHCCINLPADDRKAKAREMSTEQVKAILTEAVSLGCLKVRFTGGEPLLRPDFKELYIFARRLGLKVLIFTNARLITPQLADLLANIPPLVNMEITVYGMRPQSYEAVSRVCGSFAQFRRGVDLLRERSVPFITKMAILPPNMGEIEEFEDWSKTIPWMEHKPNYSMFFELRSRRDDIEKNQLIKSLRLPPEEGLSVLTSDKNNYRRWTNEFAGKFMSPPGDLLFRCGVGNGLCIDSYGRAQPCLGIRTPALTVDVFAAKSSVPLAECLSLFAKLRELRATNKTYLTRCALCFLKGLCTQCPAKSWAEHGTLDTPVEYLCSIAHAKARYMGWLQKGEKAWTVKDWNKRILQGEKTYCIKKR